MIEQPKLQAELLALSSDCLRADAARRHLLRREFAHNRLQQTCRNCARETAVTLW